MQEINQPGVALITLTPELIRLAQTSQGGFTQKQLETLGIDWPPPSGWARKLAGQRVPRSQFDQFVMAGVAS